MTFMDAFGDGVDIVAVVACACIAPTAALAASDAISPVAACTVSFTNVLIKSNCWAVNT